MTIVETLLAGTLLALIWTLVAISIVWACRGARRRGRSGLLVGLLVLVMAYPISLFVCWRCVPS